MNNRKKIENILSVSVFTCIIAMFMGCDINENKAASSGKVHISAFDTTLNRELEGATIFIDGIIRQEKTPAVIEAIQAGRHHLSLKPSYLDYPKIDTSFTLDPPETLEIQLITGRTDQPGVASVISDQDPLWVYVDQMFEFSVSPCLIPLSPGTHFISVYKDGYATNNPSYQIVDVRSLDTVQVTMSLSQQESGYSAGELAYDALLVSDLEDSCRISQYRGCVLLINFAGFQCDACLTELPQLQQVFEDYYGDGFRAIVINAGWWGDGPEDFAYIRNELGITMPLLYADNGGEDVPNMYHISVAPTNILVDRSGIIAERFGVTSYSELEQKILPLLN